MYLSDIIYNLFAFKIDHRVANSQLSGLAPKNWCQRNYADDIGLYKFLFEYYLYCSTLFKIS